MMVQNLVDGCRCSPSDNGVASFAEKDSVQLQQAIAQHVQGVLVVTVTRFQGTERPVMIIHMPVNGTMPWVPKANVPAKLHLAAGRAAEFTFWVGTFKFYQQCIREGVDGVVQEGIHLDALQQYFAQL